MTKKEASGHHMPRGGIQVMKYSCLHKKKLHLYQVKLPDLNSHL